MKTELEQLKSLLWREWDPIGVNDVEEAKGEYDGYAIRLFSMLNAGAQREEIVGYLSWAQTENMGMKATDIHGAIADRVMAIHEEAK